MSPFENDKPFWLVWNPSRSSPTFRHYSEECAKTEAARLARKAPGERFYVLEAIGCVVKQDVLWRGFQQRDADDGIPF